MMRELPNLKYIFFFGKEPNGFARKFIIPLLKKPENHGLVHLFSPAFYQDLLHLFLPAFLCTSSSAASASVASALAASALAALGSTACKDFY